MSVSLTHQLMGSIIILYNRHILKTRQLTFDFFLFVYTFRFEFDFKNTRNAYVRVNKWMYFTSWHGAAIIITFYKRGNSTLTVIRQVNKHQGWNLPLKKTNTCIISTGLVQLPMIDVHVTITTDDRPLPQCVISFV